MKYLLIFHHIEHSISIIHMQIFRIFHLHIPIHIHHPIWVCACVCVFVSTVGNRPQKNMLGWHMAQECSALSLKYFIKRKRCIYEIG